MGTSTLWQPSTWSLELSELNCCLMMPTVLAFGVSDTPTKSSEDISPQYRNATPVNADPFNFFTRRLCRLPSPGKQGKLWSMSTKACHRHAATRAADQKALEL